MLKLPTCSKWKKEMLINISNLKKGHLYENDKIKISFTVGYISKELSVYLKDDDKKEYQVLWEICTSSLQIFDRTNEKVRLFIQNIVNEWLLAEEQEIKAREQLELELELQKEKKIKKLMDSF